jgi:hypothetical protein
MFVSAALLLFPLTSPMRPPASVNAAGLSFAPNLSAQEVVSDIYCPYWYLDPNTSAVLEITNNGAVSRTVAPTLSLMGSEHFELDAVTIPPNGTRRISLNQVLKSRVDHQDLAGGIHRWGDGSRIGSLWGSAEIESEMVETIAAKIVTENPTQSLAVHSGFYKYAGKSVSSMWWLPTRDTVALFALQNTSYSKVAVNTIVYLGGQVIAGRRINLPAGGSSLVDLNELLPRRISKKGLPEVGMVRFIADGDSASIMGRTVLFDEQRGFSLPLAMHGALTQLTNKLQLAGAPLGRLGKKLGFSKNTKFTTQLLMTNTSSKAINVTVTLDGRNSAGEPISWDMPVIEIGPLESRAVDLNKVRIKSQSPIVDGHVGVRLTHTGTGLDLSAEAVTVDQTLRLSFDNALYDNYSVGRVYNAVSFNLKGKKNTLLLIKNTTNATANFGFRLNYEKDGVVQSYRATLSELKPYELRVVDIRALKDAEVADAEGRILPADVKFGNANIYSDKPIISGDPNFDAGAGISASCIALCPSPCAARLCFDDNGEVCNGCTFDPSLCQQNPNCDLPCRVCRGRRDRATLACFSALTVCEAAATVNFNNAITACENQAFCREDQPTFDPDECNRCKDSALQSFLIATAACSAVFAICMLAREDCTLTLDCNQNPCSN